MKAQMQLFAEAIASASKVTVAVPPMGPPFDAGPGTPGLRLVEEAAALEHAGPFLGRDLDVSRGEQEDLVRDALHAAVERVREPAGEVDQPLRQLLVAALEVEDHRHPVLEAVGDLLRVVEAARQDEMHLRHRRHGGGHALDAAQAARLRRGAKHARAGTCGLRVGPVVELLTAPPPRREPAHVGPLCIGALQVLVREIAVLVPLLLLGDAEVDEGLVPDVGEAHGCAESYSGRRSPKTEEPTRTYVAPSSTATL